MYPKYGIMAVMGDVEETSHCGSETASCMRVSDKQAGYGRCPEMMKEPMGSFNDAEAGMQAFYASLGNELYEQGMSVGEIVMDARTGQPKAKTSHSLNPVPCFVWDPSGTAKARLSAAAQKGGLGITSLTATCI